MMMITMKMNVIGSTESIDTMTFINNEQSIIISHCVFSYFLRTVLIPILNLVSEIRIKN